MISLNGNPSGNSSIGVNGNPSGNSSIGVNGNPSGNSSIGDVEMDVTVSEQTPFVLL